MTAEAPPPPSNPKTAAITKSDLLHRLQAGQTPGIDFLLVDLRRTDHEGGTIRGSLNLPAQSIHASLPTLYRMCSKADINEVIFWCGSSRGRGPRAAGWFEDYIRTQHGSSIRSVVLEGGIKGWATGGAEYVKEMEGYEESVWAKEEKA